MNKHSKLGSYWAYSGHSHILYYRLLVICEDSEGGLVFVTEKCTETGEPFGEDRPTIVTWLERDTCDLEPFFPVPSLKEGLVLADRYGSTQAFLLQNKWGVDRLWRILDNSTWASRATWEADGYTNFRQAMKAEGDHFDITVN